jgi:hypothetical protein
MHKLEIRSVSQSQLSDQMGEENLEHLGHLLRNKHYGNILLIVSEYK